MPMSRVEYWTQKFSRNRERDKKAKRSLLRAGWRVLIVWECQTRDQSHLMDVLAAFLR